MNKLFRHQLKSVDFSKKKTVIYDCSDPGTGKTAVRITAFVHRRKKHKKAALVFAPRTLLRNTWVADIHKFAPGLKPIVVTAETKKNFELQGDIYITNIDAVKWIAKLPKSFFEKFDELIIDESSLYKHHTTGRSKAIAKIAKYFTYRTCMTGTPNGRSITDVWHQVFILDGGQRLGPSFYSFRNSVCEPRQVGRRENQVNWTDKEGAEEAVFDLLSDIVIRHKFEDCVDIPANHKYTVSYELSPKHRRSYDEMERAQMLMIRQKTKDFKVITAQNAAIVANKLLQIASGAVYDEDGKYHIIDDGRYTLIGDLVESREHSLVLFQWKHQRDMLVKEFESRGLSYCVIDGDSTDDERDTFVKAYQKGAYDVMLGHPKTVGHGITLTRGTTTIWASPTYDLELFVQASKRQHRMGQTQKTETITVLAEGTVDGHVHSIVEQKNKRMNNLLDLFATL